ncbi:MAG: hypothetical protein ACYS5W_12230 [Planctomycetota bacterium]|jgi:hypothetical protein
MKHHHASLTVIALVLASAVAFAQTKKVFPAIDTTQEGPSQFCPPFSGNPTSASRYQQICGTSVVASLSGAIKQIAWRRANTLASAGDYAAWSPPIDLTLSTSPRPAAKMSNVFANNVGTDAKLMFSGVLNWPAEKKKNPGPSPFSYVVPGKSAFVYIATKGDLLIDIIRKPGAASPSPFCMDAHPDSISAKPPVITDIGAACGPKGKNINYPFGSFLPGAYARSLLYNAANNSATVWSIGTKKQTFDLGLAGAPGCWLYHNNALLVFGKTNTRTTPYTSRWDLFIQVPDNPALGGLTFFTQYVMLQDTVIGNPLGWSVSNAKQIVVGSFTPGRPYFMEISAASTAATASLVQTTGYITEFTY